MAESSRRDWRGGTGWALLILGVIERVIGIGGSIDFVLTRSQDPGWVGVVLHRAVENVGLLLMLVGVAFIVWNERRRTARLVEGRLAILSSHVPSPSPDRRPSPSIKTEPASTPDGPRILLGSNVTPTFLAAQHENKTFVDGEAATRKYLGKWMKAEGVFYNLSRLGDHRYWATLKVPRKITLIPGHDMDFPLDVKAEFETDVERLLVAQQGDWMVVEGRLDRVTAPMVELVSCSLIDINVPKKTKAAAPPPEPPEGSEAEKSRN